MSKQIQQPLNHVLGAINLLQKYGDLDSESHEVVEKAAAHGDILLSQINNVLDANKLLMSEFELIRKPSQIRKIVWSVVYANLMNIKDTGNSFLLNVSPRVPKWLLLDSNKFTQLLMNLLNNSIQFTKQGNIEIEIE